jgi:hypothetical protein
VNEWHTHRSLVIGLAAALAACGADDLPTSSITAAVCPVGETCGGGGDHQPPPELRYFGGKVISSPHVVQVVYGNGDYLPEIINPTPPSMASFYAQIVSNGTLDWLNEYSTTTPEQTIGRGSLYKVSLIAPAPANNGQTILDGNLRSELAAQIQQGTLPWPDDQIVYMVHLPRGRTLVDSIGERSCETDGICGYHSTFKLGAQNVYYAALPDLRDGQCPAGCGGSTPFFNQSAVASHELIETITDPEIGLAPSGPAAAPVAWYDDEPHRGEIADICNQGQGAFLGTDGFSYVAELEWSNAQVNADGTHGHCILTRPTLPRTADVLWRNTTNGTLVEWMMSGATIAATPQLSIAEDLVWRVEGVADFGGDGHSDVLWRNVNDGTLIVWLMNRSAVRAALTLSEAKGAEWKVEGVADFDGDGRADVLWRNTNDGTMIAWLMSGGTVLAKPQLPLAEDLVWRVERTADFDGDGRADVLWRNTHDGTMVLWLMSGGAILSVQHLAYAEDLVWKIEGTADFNGDGKSDLLWRNVNDGTLVIWLMQGATLAGFSQLPYVEDLVWHVEGTADFDGDGKGDILWRNVNDGTIILWRMSGGTIASVSTLQMTQGAEWRVEGIGDFAAR